jgi:hypothetical protein
VDFIFPLLLLSGAEEEFLQEAEIQSEVKEQWEEVLCAFRMVSKIYKLKINYRKR